MTKSTLLLGSLLALVLIGVVSVGAASASAPMLTLNQLTEASDSIVRGTVVGLHSHWNDEHTLIYTSVNVAVQEYLTGDGQESQIVVEVPGGVVGDLGLTVSEAPTFEKGQEVILFLQKEEGHFQVVGWFQGKYSIVGNLVVEKGMPVSQFIGQIHSALRRQGIQPGLVLQKGLAQPVTESSQMQLDVAPLRSSDGTLSRKNVPEEAESHVDAAAAVTIMTEDFEGTFPGTKWALIWNTNSSQAGYGYTWGRDAYRVHGGSRSGWAAGGQWATNPDLNGPGPYPNYMNGWMIYGPFSLTDATDAELLFYHWSKTESGYDKFCYYASINGSSFAGICKSGDWASSCSGWCYENFDLTTVYTLGNLCGQSQVWIAFRFYSDNIITYEGTYLDDITLWKQTGGGAVPHIDGISPDHGPAHADQLGSSGCAADSTHVTITGSDFGATQGSGYVRFWREGSTYYNACVESWSNTQIVARVPGRVSSGNVVVVTSGGTSNEVYFTVTYSYGGGKWPAGSYPQPMSEEYKVNASGGPAGALASIQAAGNTWTNVSGKDFYFRYGGVSAATTYGYDDENSILWQDLATGVLAVNSYWWNTSDPHTIIESDIAFNTDYTWSTDCSAGTYDVQALGTHEMGHSLNLLDLYGTADTAKVMYGFGGVGECKRALHTHDIAGISYIYPCAWQGTPSNPSPQDGALGVSVEADLDWADATGATEYAVYFGTSSPPPYWGSVAPSAFTMPTLDPSTHYYWMVVARSDCGETSGPEWDFTTCSLPGVPSNPSPQDGAMGVSVEADLDWADATGATSYAVYFGTSSPPPYWGSVAPSAFTIPTLDPSTHYYWRVVAGNDCGETSGPEWDFTTASPNNPPTAVSVTPTGGSSMPEYLRTVQAAYEDQDGWQDLANVYLMWNASATDNIQQVRYEVATRKLYIRDDANSAWVGGFTLGTAIQLSNTNLTLDVAQTSVSTTTTQVRVNWGLIPKQPMTSVNWNSYLKAVDSASQSTGWVSRGTWRINMFPNVGGLSPASGNAPAGTAQMFTITYTDEDGAATLGNAFILAKMQVSPYTEHLKAYYNRAANKMYMYSGSSWIGGLTPGVSGTAESAYAILDAGASSVTQSGKVLTVNWNITFKAGTEGVKDIWGYIYDNQNFQDGYVLLGHWTVGAGAAASAPESAPPVAEDPIPLDAPADFQPIYRTPDLDPDSPLSGMVAPDKLRPDFNAPIMPGEVEVVPVVKGMPKPLPNVRPSPLGVPAAGLFQPASGNRAPGWGWNFRAQFSDPSGYAHLSQVYILFSMTGLTQNAIYIRYDQDTNKVYLRDSADTTWIGGYAPGSNVKISNKNGTLDMLKTTKNNYTNYLDVLPQVVFKSLGQSQRYRIFVAATDDAGNALGWVEKGWHAVNMWAANGGLTPSNNAQAVGVTHSYATTYTDPDGASDLLYGFLNVASSVAGKTQALYANYNVAANQIRMLADDGTTWLGPITPGAAQDIQNSWVIIHGAGCSTSIVGDKLTVTWSFEFKSPMAGTTKNVYLYAQDKLNWVDTWDYVGQIQITP